MNQQRSATVTALTIVGLDPSDGAGIQVGMKAMSVFGSYAISVITASTVQSTRGVVDVYAVPVEFVRLQMDTLPEDIIPDAAEIGVLATAELVDTAGEYLPGFIRTVLDPATMATSGDRFLNEQAVDAVRRLYAKTDLITPDLYEAAALLGKESTTTLGGPRNQAQRLRDLGACRVLVRGGYLSGDTGDAVDVYADVDGVEILCGRRVSMRNTHGTGCTLSSVIASLQPCQVTWLGAVRDAKDYLASTIAYAEALGVGYGRRPVHYSYRAWTRTGWQIMPLSSATSPTHAAKLAQGGGAASSASLTR